MMKWLVDQYCAIPAEWRAGVFSWCKSFAMSSLPILGVLYGTASSQGHAATLGDFVAWCHANYFGVVMGYIFSGGTTAAYRGKQAFTSVKTNTPITP